MSNLGEQIKRLERYISRGKAEKALDGYERLQSRFPNDQVINNRVAFLRNTLHRHAPEWQVRTYVISPRAIAEAHIIAERYDIALEILEGLHEAQPDEQGLARRVAMVRSMRDGKKDAGLEATASTQIMSPEILIDAHLAGGDVHAALRLLQKLCQRRPHDNKLQRRMQSLSAAWDAQLDEQVSLPSIHPSPKKVAGQPPPLPGRRFEFEVAEVETGRPATNEAMDDVSGVFTSNKSSPNLSDDDSLLTETQVEIPQGIYAQKRSSTFPATPNTSNQEVQKQSDAEGLEDDFELSSTGLQDLLQAARDVIQSNRNDDPFEAAVAHHKRTKNLRHGKTDSASIKRQDTAAKSERSQSSARLRAQKLDAAALLRNESIAERRALGSAQDLLTAQPHQGRHDGALLKSSRALPKADKRRPDIHEQITDTGTDPRIKFQSPSIMPHTMEAQAVALAIRDKKEKLKIQQQQKLTAKKISPATALQDAHELSPLREDWDAMADDFDDVETAANPELYAALHRAKNKAITDANAIKANAADFVDDEPTIADEQTYKTLDELNPEDFEETAAGKDPRQARLKQNKKS